ncbi:MAG: tetratricopeptide repeat protein, partial [Ignavibacteriaceae bacterium]|nr:tetratricopeptide repeat protein [Ignavibacteriaceae bacterium]
MMRRYFSRIKVISLIAAISLFAGCSLWQNFTTFFNLYYNTSLLFEEAESEIYLQKRDLFSTEPLIVSGAANTKLVKVIEKSSKLLQFYSNSAYVEDALMMLGKSFFYQKNYPKSRRKFEELLGTNPNDDMRLESELWIAKCSMNLKEFTSGLTLLERIRAEAIEDDDERITRETYIEEIVYRISQEDYSQAIQLAEQMIPYSNSEMKSSIYFELGKLYALIGDIENAISSYANVFEYSPDFDLEIAANINYAKSLRDADRDEEALDVFRDIRSEDKFKEKYSEIDLETAVTLEKLNRFDEALEQFTMIDTTYKGTPVSAASSYFKGRIYEYTSVNYDSAAFYYQKASTSNPQKEYAQSVKEKNQIFTKYFSLRNQINNYNRQLFYSENPEVFVQDSINYVQDSVKILSDYLEKKEMLEIWSNVFKPDSNAIKDSLLALDSLRIQDSL